MTAPTFTNDAIVFGILMISLGFVFFTENLKTGFWVKFYKIVPGLFMAYFIPAIFTTIGLIAPEWETTNAMGETVATKSQLYYVSSRFLLPAALVLMTLSIDLKAIFNLGSKALIMFFTGTIGIIIGGPLAILLIAIFSPETVERMALMLFGVDFLLWQAVGLVGAPTKRLCLKFTNTIRLNTAEWSL